MSQFHISAQKPQLKVRFAEPKAEVSTESVPVVNTQAASGVAPDQIKLSGRQTHEQKPAAVDLFADTPKPKAEAFMDRLTTRQSEFTVGSEVLQMELGVESQAPEILTSAHEPSTAESIKNRFQNAKDLTSGDQVVRTGARLQPSEHVQVQLGMASSVNTGALMSTDKKGETEQENPFKPGVYAGVAVKMEGFSTRVAVDTALGQPRVEVGTALSAGDTATVGVSFLQHTEDKQQTLRLGAEVKPANDTVLGVNLNQPLHQGSVGDVKTAAVGLYLNTRFD